MNTESLRTLCSALLAAGLVVGAAAAQQGSVGGRVTDQASGQPLVGARVLVVGTTLVGAINADGRYLLRNVPAGQASVRVAYIGYGSLTRTVAVTAGQTAELDFGLAQTPVTLDEFVVTATGEQQRRELGHSVSTIRADSLVLNSAVTNMNDLLSGKVAGVDVLANALTGGGARVRIRGTNSLSLNNEPIYYIDGVRMESSVNSSSIGIGGTNPSRVNDINPEEIESMELVKGPSAATLYGTDAANGVIVIKTKRGRPGPPQWNVYSELGVMRDWNDWPEAYTGWTAGSTPTNGVQCILTRVASGACTQDSVGVFNLFEDPDASPNGTGWRGQLGLQVSGGSDVARYFISGEYEEEIGLLRMPDFAYARVLQTRQISEVPYDQYRPNARERTSVRANLQASLSPKLDVSVSTGFISSTQRLPQTDNNTTGLLSNGFGGPGHKNNASAISGLQNYGYRLFTPDEFFAETVTQDINRFIGSGSANWRPNAWLAARFSGGIDFTSRVDEDICRRDECVAFATRKTGFKRENRTTFFQYTLEANGAATFQLNPALQTKTTVGLQYFQDLFARNGAFAEDLPPGATTLTSGAIPSVNEATDEAKTLGAFVEQQFGWNGRLYVTAALRADDNSAFGANFSAVYYPKFSVSYVISEEPFFPALGWLSNLRLRGALGASGTQPGSTDAIRFFAPTTSSVDGLDRPALVFSEIGNSDLKPERATEVELGFDAALLDSRVTVDFTYYYKRTQDALIERTIAPSAGTSADRFENLGSIRNTGVEVLVNALVIDRPSFGWDLTLTASTNQNKILELGVPPIVGTTIQQREGYPINGWWQRPYTYSDANGNGIIEASEITVADSAAFVGPSNPTREVTLSTGFNFLNRRLRISGLFDHKGGRYQLNGTERIRCESRLNCDGLIDPNAPLWKQARVVALRETAARTQYGFMEKADFIRLREVAATYELPASFARALRAGRLSVTLAGRNMFLITDYSGLDPESAYFSGATGIQSDFQTAPPPTYWTLRFNASL